MTRTLVAWLKLGRVSNLATVWTNVLAAVAVAQYAFDSVVLTLMLVHSVFYVAGMILNDAYDAGYDAVARPQRPIPAGLISVRAAFTAGYVLLGLAALALALVANATGGPVLLAAGGGLALAGCIVYYDAHHKGNALGPLWMGACRALVFLCVGLGLGTERWGWVLGAGALQWAYVVGLTYAAKQEDVKRSEGWWPLGVLALPITAWLLAAWLAPDLGLTSRLLLLGTLAAFVGWLGWALHFLWQEPKRIGLAVGWMIAGIAMLDAVAIAATGRASLVLWALGAAMLTRAAQRYIPGT